LDNIEAQRSSTLPEFAEITRAICHWDNASRQHESMKLAAAKHWIDEPARVINGRVALLSRFDHSDRTICFETLADSVSQLREGLEIRFL
jgi:hypothetical protein